MKLILLIVALAGCGHTTPSQAYKRLTEQTRPSFESPGDAVTLSPSADSGPFSSDPNSDCSSCPPR